MKSNNRDSNWFAGFYYLGTTSKNEHNHYFFFRGLIIVRSLIQEKSFSFAVTSGILWISAVEAIMALLSRSITYLPGSFLSFRISFCHFTGSGIDFFRFPIFAIFSRCLNALAEFFLDDLSSELTTLQCRRSARSRMTSLSLGSDISRINVSINLSLLNLCLVSQEEKLLVSSYFNVARRSCISNSGWSAIISSKLIPEPIKSRTISTGHLIPRMQGFPKQMSGFIVIRFSSSSELIFEEFCGSSVCPSGKTGAYLNP